MTDILQEASELINGQRAKDYGPVTENFERIADLWNSYLGISAIDHYDVANMMILVKLARVRNAGYHRDSYADIAGYAALAEKVAQSSAPVSEDFWAGVDQSIVEAQEKRERDRTQKPPRVWKSLTQVPEGVLVHDADGDCEWESEGPDGTTENDKYGPFIEILDFEPEGSK